MADVILAFLVFSPAVLTYILKSNAAMAFLALSGAFVLITLGNADLRELTDHLDLRLDSSTLNFILLSVPLFLTLLLTRRAFSGRIKRLAHLVTALCAGGLMALVTVPSLNVAIAADFADSWGWPILEQLQTPLIAVGLVLSLFLIWFGKRSKAGKHHK